MAGNELAVCPVCGQQVAVWPRAGKLWISSHTADIKIAANTTRATTITRAATCGGSYWAVDVEDNEQAADGGEEHG